MSLPDDAYGATVVRPLALIEGCSIEINAQRALLWAVTLPIALLFAPTILVSFFVFLIAHELASVTTSLQWLSDWTENHWALMVSTLLLMSAAVAGYHLRHRAAGTPPERRLLPLTGRAGNALIDIVTDL